MNHIISQNHMKNIHLILVALIFLSVPAAFSFAQQLRIVEGDATTTISEPAVYRAYYGKLSGEPHVYTFTAPGDIFPIKLVVLQPDVAAAKTDVSVALIDELHPEAPFAVADGSVVEWTRFFDTTGRDSYLAGPSLEATVPSGHYQIRVWSSNNDSPYVLIVEGKQPFSLGEVLRRFSVVPAIKSDFFGKPAYQAYLTPLLLWPILSVLIVLGLVLFITIVFFRRRADVTV